MTFKNGNPNPGLPDEVMVVKVASLAAEGIPTTQMAEQLGASFQRIKRILAKEETQALIKEIGQSAVDQAKARVHRTLSLYTPLALEALKKNLEEGDLKAVEIYFKALGLYAPAETKAAGPASITVVLPGQSPEQPKDIEIEAQDVAE